MADEKPGSKNKHSITMEQREKIYITGILDVLSFDEESITAETDYGTLILRGFGLHVIKLDLDAGDLDVEGEIDSLIYEEGGGGKSKGSFFSKIFK